MKKRISLLYLLVGIAIGAGIMHWCARYTHKKVPAMQIDDFYVQRDALIEYVYKKIKKQCSFFAKTPDFIAGLTPYYKHKKSCVDLSTNFFGNEPRCKQAFLAIGSQAHQDYMFKTLQKTHDILAKNKRKDPADVLDSVMRETPYRDDVKEGVYDDAYFENTAISLLTVAAQKNGAFQNNMKKRDTKIESKIKNRSKWRR